MRILVHDYAGHPFQVQLSRELARRGHQVTHAFAGALLTPRGDLAGRANDPKGFRLVEVHMSPDYKPNKYRFLKRRQYEVQYGRDLVRLINDVKPDLVLSGNTPTEPQWNLIKTSVRQGVAVITWLQDFYSLAVDKLARKKIPVIGALAGRWYRHLDACCFRSSAHIVSITEDFIPILDKFGVHRSKVTTIPNWAPLDELPLRPRQNLWSSRHGLDQSFVFQYSGTLAMKHNPDLLRQLAVNFRSDPNVRVVVVSEGPGAEYLAKCKGSDKLDNLILLPFQSFSDVPDMLASSDVLIAVLEPDAGIFSVPSKVLTYHCARRAILGAIPADNLAARIIRQQRSGVCVPPNDVGRFVSVARQLRNNPEDCNRMADSGRDYAVRDFDLDRIGNRFETLLRDAASGFRLSIPR